MEQQPEPRSRARALGAAALGHARHVVSALAWDNPLAWRRFHGRHPLADLEGPEYRPLAPFREVDLASVEERAAGVELVVSGRVHDRATGEPVGHAVLDVWQASPRTGRYSQTGWALRGRFRADAKGRYYVRTVMPPRVLMRRMARVDSLLFGLPHTALSALSGEPVTFVRPSHLHVIVRARGYRPLTTQIYFGHAEDAAAEDAANAIRPRREALEVDAEPGHDGGPREVRFDFAIDRRGSAGAARTAARDASHEDARRAAEVHHVPAAPPDEPAITARPKEAPPSASGVVAEEGLAVDSDALARQILADATQQGNFESFARDRARSEDGPVATDETAGSIPLEGDEDAWEASVSRALEREPEEDEPDVLDPAERVRREDADDVEP